MAQPLTATGDETSGVRVLLASADAGLRDWAQDCLPADVTLCALTDDGSDIAERAGETRAHVCLLDLRLPGGAMAALSALVEAVPAVRIVAWASSDGDPGLLEAVDAGATGCIAGMPDRRALGRALADVMAGRSALPRAVEARVVAHLRLPERGPVDDEPSHRSES